MLIKNKDKHKNVYIYITALLSTKKRERERNQLKNSSTENQVNYGKSTEWNSMQPLKSMRYLYMLMWKALLDHWNIIFKIKKNKVQNHVYHMTPSIWIEIQIVNGMSHWGKGIRKETRHFHFSFFIFLYCLNCLADFEVFCFLVTSYVVKGDMDLFKSHFTSHCSKLIHTLHWNFFLNNQ